MRRGEIWVVSLDPSFGSEAAKSRPAVIVSNDARNSASRMSGRGVLTVVPLTRNIASVLMFQVLVKADLQNGLGEDSKAQAEQIRAVDASRFVRRIGSVSTETLSSIEAAIMLHLGLD